MTYILFLIFLAVLSRESGTSNSVKLELFWGYDEQKDYLIKDKLVNVVSFIPLGILAGIVFKKHRVIKALLLGMLVSSVIEFSQLIWSRGTFDLDDLLNNAFGALVGALLVVAFIAIGKRV